jgi:threonine dehydrogenase-like Zn-dependent dehydrogenase
VRAVTSRNGIVELVERDTPVVDDRQVLVAVTSTGICGSDLHMVAAGMSGVILGHEFGGRLTDGTLVAVRPTGECGTCASCVAHLPQLCRVATSDGYGIGVDGGLADHVRVDPSRLIRMAPGVSERDVALVEPIAVAVHGIERSRVTSEDRVLVIGAGSIGLVTVAALRHRGIEVDVVARHPHQMAAAEALGASLAVTSGYDVVFDAVCTQEAVDQAVHLCRPGGTVLEFGLFWSPVTLTNALLLKEVTFVPSIYYSHDHSRNDVEEAAEVLAASSDLADILVTHHLDLDAAVRAFEIAADRSAGSIKVHLHP